VQESIAADLELIKHYEMVIGEMELAVVRRARGHDPNAFQLLRTIPGVGKILALTILYEIHDIARFERVQQFASYSRLVKCQHSSAGKVVGEGGGKMGNAYLKWAFSEAAVLFLAKCPEGKPLLARLQTKHGKAKALSILAHRLGRAVYFMLARKRAFDLERFLRN
jgi:transposase